VLAHYLFSVWEEAMRTLSRAASSLCGAVVAALSTVFLTEACAVESLQVEGGHIADAAPNAMGIRLFKGIPYAAAPVGARRWKPPQPVQSWSGIRSVAEWGPRCLQSDRLGDLDPLNKRMDEDCLYLNVWTPTSNGQALPVMVWIHGGSNLNGAGSQPEYDGGHLAGKGVVVVTINYRLDVFGFLAHPELTRESDTKSSGNYGLLDQIAALKWVQKNIRVFGGDPDQVTVFGESAGSIDISLLMASPLAKGLFKRAIGESGAALTPNPAFGPKPLQIGEQGGIKFAESIGADSIAQLRAKSGAEILNAAIKNPILYAFGVVDGYVVPEHPASIYAQGRQNDVAVLVGWNADEGSLFAARGTLLRPGAPSYTDRMRAQFKDLADAALKLYPAGSTAEEERASFTALLGDQIIGYGTWAWAERASTSGKSAFYRYYFTRRPPGAPELSLHPLAAPGVYHFAEVVYAFNNLQVMSDWSWEPEDRRLADAMASYWTNFAKTGDPNAADLPQWPAYKPGGGGQVMELGKLIGSCAEPHRDRYEFFDAFYRKAAPE
jgi:para-nitrobenzyl esterase